MVPVDGLGHPVRVSVGDDGGDASAPRVDGDIVYGTARAGTEAAAPAADAIPRTPLEHDADHRHAVGGGLPALLRPLRVLIAEDDPLVAYHLEGLVRRVGQTVVGTAATADEVVRIAIAERPDVVLMDIWLEGRSNGIEVTRQLVDAYELPIILISGTSNSSVIDDVIASGALGFISKPVTGPELQANLRIVRQRQDLLNRLRESEGRFRSIFDNAAVGIYVSTLEGRLITVNDTYARMLGYAGQAEMLRLVRDLSGQVYDDPACRDELCETLLAGGVVTGLESLVYGRDGEALWISEHCRLVTGAEGTPTRYEGIVVDITARKDAEARERTTMELLRSTMDALPDLVILQDLERNVIMVNRACMDMGLFAPGGTMCEDPVREGGVSPFALFLEDGAEHEGAVRLAGVPGTWHSRVAPFRAPGGETVGAVEILRRDAVPGGYGVGDA